MQTLLISFYNFGLGGVQRKIADIVNYLESSTLGRDWRVILFFRNQDDFSFTNQLKKSNRWQIFYSPFESFPLFIAYYLYLVLKFHPRFILTFLHNSLFQTVIVKKFLFWLRIPVFMGQDNIASYENQSEYSKRVYPDWLYRWLYRQPTLIFTQTQYAKQDLIKKYQVDANKISVIPNWVARRPLLKKTKKYDLIYCGRLAKQKNLQALIKVVAQLKKIKPDIKLLLVGEGEEKNVLKKNVRELKLDRNIFFHSLVENVYPFISQAKIFCLTSFFEGQPMVLLESSLMKVPVVAIDYPGLSEYLVNRQTGYIVKNERQMVRVITQLLADEKQLKQVGDQARKVALADFEAEKRILQTLNIIFEHLK